MLRQLGYSGEQERHSLVLKMKMTMLLLLMEMVGVVMMNEMVTEVIMMSKILKFY